MRPITYRVAAGSGVVCCFLDELYAGGQAELGVDMGEVGLHRPR
jgi:hypothetical protein